MSRLIRRLACLFIALSIGMTSLAHAMGPQIDTLPRAAGHVAEIAEGHVSGDADQVPADGGKGYPHHHGGCHGDHMVAPIKVAAAPQPINVSADPRLAIDGLRPRATADPTLRPPRA